MRITASFVVDGINSTNNTVYELFVFNRIFVEFVSQFDFNSMPCY